LECPRTYKAIKPIFSGTTMLNQIDNNLWIKNAMTGDINNVKLDF